MTLRIWSNDLVDGGRLPDAQVFDGMGYAGGNLSPHLAWEGEPEGVKSFVVTCFDPDAPTGSGWWHWIVSDIPADVHELPTGAGSGRAPLPAPAIQSRTDFGFSHYGGAAPPRGEVHRYVFTVHAVTAPSLGVDDQASGALVGFVTNAHRAAKASLTVTYGG
ncbi:MAG: kinase inhibitor [Hyphomicrobiales bacterium]|nr:kinase inhibitor [Hyphomicrobiales bacterium]